MQKLDSAMVFASAPCFKAKIGAFFFFRAKNSGVFFRFKEVFYLQSLGF